MPRPKPLHNRRTEDMEKCIIFEKRDVPEIAKLKVYQGAGGYKTLEKVLKSRTPDEVTAEVMASGLRGRGGAGFPTGKKWSFIPKSSSKPVYLLCNADEGEPGTFKDRVILEELPHLLIEGMLLAAYAIRCKKSYIYIRYEYFDAIRILEKAIQEAYDHNLLGTHILGTEFTHDIILQTGAGAYICGEETALISSLEGKKGYPKLKPPFPAIEGFLKCPTIVNNVETLASVPYILKHGGKSYAQIGTPQSTGTKLFSISGDIARPGTYELEMGTPFDELIYEVAGGIPNGQRLKAVVPGGSSAPVLTADEVHQATLDFESIASFGSMLGSGAVFVLDDTRDMAWVLSILTEFYAHESCGQCTPCREGTGWLNRVLKTIVRGEGTENDLELIKKISERMCGTTICVLADAIAMPAISYLKKFPDDFYKYVRSPKTITNQAKQSTGG